MFLLTYFFFNKAWSCNSNQPLYLNQQAQPNKAPLVIGLGDSLMRWSIPSTQWFDDIRWLRLTKARGRWDSFSNISTKLKKLKPDMIMVQDILFLKPAELSYVIKVRKTILYFIAPFYLKIVIYLLIGVILLQMNLKQKL